MNESVEREKKMVVRLVLGQSPSYDSKSRDAIFSDEGNYNEASSYAVVGS